MMPRATGATAGASVVRSLGLEDMRRLTAKAEETAAEETARTTELNAQNEGSLETEQQKTVDQV